MRQCQHDRDRDGCTACDRIVLEQRAAAMAVLGLDEGDIEIAQRARTLRGLMRENGIDPTGARFLLADADAQRVLEVVRRMRQTAAADHGALDHRTTVDRHESHLRVVKAIAESHARRARTPNPESREHHESCAATWAAEAAIERDVLELLGHAPTVDEGAKGDQA